MEIIELTSLGTLKRLNSETKEPMEFNIFHLMQNKTVNNRTIGIYQVDNKEFLIEVRNSENNSFQPLRLSEETFKLFTFLVANFGLQLYPAESLAEEYKDLQIFTDFKMVIE